MRWVVCLLAVVAAAVAYPSGYPFYGYKATPAYFWQIAPNAYPQENVRIAKVLGNVPTKKLVAIDETEQFHAQDGTGQFSFGFREPNQARLETRDKTGAVRGSYSYLDPYGRAVKVQYTADNTGFHVSGDNLPEEFIKHIPKQVPYTESVKRARKLHFQLYEEALERAKLSGYGNEDKVPSVVIPSPVVSAPVVSTPVVSAPVVQFPVAPSPVYPPVPVASPPASPPNVENDAVILEAPKPGELQEDRPVQVQHEPSLPTPEEQEGPVDTTDFDGFVGTGSSDFPEDDQDNLNFYPTLPEGTPTGDSSQFEDDSAVIINNPEFETRARGRILSADHVHRFQQNIFRTGKKSNVAAEHRSIDDGSSLSDGSGRAVQQSAGFHYISSYQIPVYVEQPQKAVSYSAAILVPLSVSQKASFLGAIPAAAVHDVQVSDRQRSSTSKYSILPVYVEPVNARS